MKKIIKIVILVFILFFVVILLFKFSFRIWGFTLLTLKRVLKTTDISKQCLLGLSVELCPNGDYVVGRFNMERDGDRYTVYDSKGNFLLSEGGLVTKSVSILYTKRILLGQKVGCYDGVDKPSKIICR